MKTHLIALIWLSALVWGQQKEPAWEEADLVQMDSHFAQGNDSVWKATGCTYWKKCWTIIEVHLQQADRTLVLQEKVQWRKSIGDMNGEVPRLREGDHVRFHQSEAGVYVLLDRDANAHTFVLAKVIGATAAALSNDNHTPTVAASSVVHDPAVSTHASPGPVEEALIGVWFTGNPTVRHDGVEVAGVQPQGPADGIDLRPGDVILAIDGHYLYTIDDLRTELLRHKPGARLKIQYRHDRLISENYLILGSEGVTSHR